MGISDEVRVSLTQLMQSDPNIVGFSEDVFEGGAVRVYVKSRLREAGLGEIEGHRVEYVEVGQQQKIAKGTSPTLIDVDPRTRVRPLVGGLSISPAGANYSGTLGYFMRRNSDKAVGVLSCAHVLPDGSEKRVIQQSGEDGGTTSDIVASLAASVDNGTTVDCAFALLGGSITYTLEVNAIGPVTGSRAAENGEAVKKSGRTTKVTAGKITDVNATIVIGNDTYVQQILIETSSRFAAGGDSGSLLVADRDKKGLGLVMSTNVPLGTRTFANNIGLVEAALASTLA